MSQAILAKFGVNVFPKIVYTGFETAIHNAVTTVWPGLELFEFCSDVSFIGTIFSRNWHLLFVLTLLISDLTFVFSLLLLLVSCST
jgi:hypothetical protein